MKPKIASIVVGWNSSSDLRQCLTSLVEQEYSNHEIIFVDNNSDDDSVEYVSDLFPQVHIIENKRNLFFGGGNNVGIRHALNELKVDYVALLNPDAAAAKGWLGSAVEYMETNSKVGAIGPKVLFWEKFIEISFPQLVPPLKSISTDGSDYHKLITVYPGWKKKWELDADGNWLTGLDIPAKLNIDTDAKNIHLDFATTQETIATIKVNGELLPLQIKQGQATVELEPKQIGSTNWVINSAGTECNGHGIHHDIGYGDWDNAKYDQASSVAGINGVAMVIRSEALRATGGFDTTYNMYIEESDLCERITYAGYEIRYQPTSTIRHKHMQSTNQASRDRFQFWTTRNQLLFVWDHLGKLVSVRRAFKLLIASPKLGLRVIPSLKLAIIGRALKRTGTDSRISM